MRKILVDSSVTIDLNWSAYDDIAEEYERVLAPNFFEPVAAQLVSLLTLSPGQRLLDIACGTGVVARAATQRCHGLSVVGVDLSLPMMLRAKNCAACQFLVADVLELPFTKWSFHHLTASFVMNHLQDCRAAMGKMTRVLRPRGTIALTSWAIGPSENPAGTAWSEIAEAYVSTEELRNATRRVLPNEESLHSGEQLSTILRDAGLRTVRAEQIEFNTNVMTVDYIVSRSNSMSGRFMKSSLPTEKWRDFHATVIAALSRRFGDAIQIRTTVNFAVAMQ